MLPCGTTTTTTEQGKIELLSDGAWKAEFRNIVNSKPIWKLQYRATEESFLIYNYKAHYVGKIGLDWTFQEAYLF